MADGDAHFAHFAARQNMIAVIARLCRQIKGHGQARLPFGEIGAIERIRSLGRRMACICSKQPGTIFLHLGHNGPLLLVCEI